MTAFVWFDLLASKTAETRTFYNELLGWPISTAPSEHGSPMCGWTTSRRHATAQSTSAAPP